MLLLKTCVIKFEKLTNNVDRIRKKWEQKNIKAKAANKPGIGIIAKNLRHSQEMDKLGSSIAAKSPKLRHARKSKCKNITRRETRHKYSNERFKVQNEQNRQKKNGQNLGKGRADAEKE